MQYRRCRLVWRSQAWVDCWNSNSYQSLWHAGKANSLSVWAEQITLSFPERILSKLSIPLANMIFRLFLSCFGTLTNVRVLGISLSSASLWQSSPWRDDPFGGFKERQKWSGNVVPHFCALWGLCEEYTGCSLQSTPLYTLTLRKTRHERYSCHGHGVPFMPSLPSQLDCWRPDGDVRYTAVNHEPFTSPTVQREQNQALPPKTQKCWWCSRDFHLFAIRCWHWESPEVTMVSGQQIKLLFLHRQKAEQAKPMQSVWAMGCLMKGHKKCPKSATNSMAAGKRKLKVVGKEEGGRAGKGEERRSQDGWVSKAVIQGVSAARTHVGARHVETVEGAAQLRPAHLLPAQHPSPALSPVTGWLGSLASPCHFSVIFLQYSTPPRNWKTFC